MWAGVDSVWAREKPKVRKMLENAAASHTSGARFSFFINSFEFFKNLAGWMYPWQQACRKVSAFLRLSGNALTELLGEPDQKSFGAADVAEPIRFLVLNHFTYELRAVFAEPGERLVDVVHGEHDA